MPTFTDPEPGPFYYRVVAVIKGFSGLKSLERNPGEAPQALTHPRFWNRIRKFGIIGRYSDEVIAVNPSG
jgi:hypothetical protein